MTYPEAIEYLYRRLPMFSRVGSEAIKKGLRNILALCRALDDPQERIRTVHVAGTNGKGSVSHMLAAVLQSAGYRTGLYTSPHLTDYRERIRVDGEMASKEFIATFTTENLGLIESVAPSYFEISVAMAFQYFHEQRVDVAVIETGLGGRLDSTNIITPEVSVITNIGWDHMQILGDTLPEIATEKAGIIKPGIPVVVGESDPETAPVFERTARDREADIRFADRLAEVTTLRESDLLLEATVRHVSDDRERTYVLDLPGLYQSKNLLTVLATVDVLREKGWKIDDQALEEGLRHTRRLTNLMGRWETVRKSPRVVLDVAHNEPGIRQVLEQLRRTAYKRLHLVVGMVKDKDVTGVLSLLPKDAHYHFTRSGVPRALPEEELTALAASVGLHGRTHPDVNTALQSALREADPDDLILVCGSVFLVGEVDRGMLV